MKHEKIINAYMALERMSGTEIPLSISYKLFKIKKMLQPQWDFQRERIDAVIQKYKTQTNMDGSISIQNDEDKEKCVTELNDMIKEINDMDVDLNYVDKQEISLDTNIKMTISDIDALSDFINFTE